MGSVDNNTDTSISPVAPEWYVPRDSNDTPFSDLVMKVNDDHRSSNYVGFAVTFGHNPGYLVHELRGDTSVHKVVQGAVGRPHRVDQAGLAEKLTVLGSGFRMGWTTSPFLYLVSMHSSF